MNDEDEVESSSNSSVRNGNAISVRLGNNRGNAPAKAFVRLNTRCHLLAFAAKVEKQLQATVSIQ